MINIEHVCNKMPSFSSFCSVDKILSIVDELILDERFDVKVIGASEEGAPLHHIRFGQGGFKAMFVGFPHCDEPMGGMTVFSLLSLLRDECEALVNQDIEWHIVPCIDPDGARLNEGWSQKPFSLECFMKHFYKQNMRDQVDPGFSVNYKQWNFNAHTQGTKALMSVYDSVRPDFHCCLHNAMIGGSYFFLTDPVDGNCYSQLLTLLDNHHIPQKQHAYHAAYLEVLQGPILKSSGMKDYFVHMEESGKNMADILQRVDCGMSAKEYLKTIHKGSVSFVAELAHGRHPMMTSTKETGEYLRQLLLRADADNKFLMTVILDIWDKVERDLDVKSPFYQRYISNVRYAKDHIAEGLEHPPNPPLSYLLSYEGYAGKAKEHEKFDAYMTYRYSFLCHHYGFIRLLKSSKQTPAVKQGIVTLKALFKSSLDDIAEQINFEQFEAFDVNTLARVQLSSGLIVLNALLEKHAQSTLHSEDCVASH